MSTAAVAIAAGMRVDDVARIPLAYPTHAVVLVRAAVDAARKLNLDPGCHAHDEGRFGLDSQVVRGNPTSARETVTP